MYIELMIYFHLWDSSYFIKSLERNERYREFYGERFLDIIGMVTDDIGLVQVFTPKHRFISADGKHLTASGARFYAERIEWGRWLERGDR